MFKGLVGGKCDNFDMRTPQKEEKTWSLDSQPHASVGQKHICLM